jgi:hypothetical protein
MNRHYTQLTSEERDIIAILQGWGRKPDESVCKRPFQAFAMLEKAQSVYLETYVDMFGYTRPMLSFYLYAELNNGFTNWQGPNLAAAEVMLKTVGFGKIELDSVFVAGSSLLTASEQPSLISKGQSLITQEMPT